MINETEIKVRYVETDKMGVVHHSNYYHWFEVGRTEFLNALGLSYSEIEGLGILIPLIETHCTYKIGAKYEDEVIIRTKFDWMKGAKGQFSYEVLRKNDGKLLVEGTTVHTFTTLKLKPVNLKKENPKVYDFLMSCAE